MRIFRRVFKAVHNERGAGAVEMAVIILILIALAIIFKGGITTVLNAIIDKITTQVGTV